MAMSKVEQIKLEIELYRNMVSRLEKDLVEARKGTFFKCQHCHSKTKLSNVSVLSCTAYGYDDWYFVGYRIICPKCDRATRAERHDYGNGNNTLQRNFNFVRENEKAFKEILQHELKQRHHLEEKISKSELYKIRKEERERKERRYSL